MGQNSAVPESKKRQTEYISTNNHLHFCLFVEPIKFSSGVSEHLARAFKT